MNISDAAARRYLLGTAGEDERETLESAYFADPQALDAIEAAEERLIESYLAGELEPADRSQFEREYLVSPDRRRRVETVRRLTSAAANTAKAAPGVAATRRQTGWRGGYLALAASLLVAVIAGTWLLTSTLRRPSTTASSAATAANPQPAAGTPTPPPAAPRPSRVVALSLAPIHTRGAEETPAVTLARDIDTLDLELQLDGAAVPRTRTRAVVQTVSGQEVWRGDAAADPNAAAARVSVPAGRLTTDDYIVSLVAVNAAGTEDELGRYFFRVRVP